MTSLTLTRTSDCPSEPGLTQDRTRYALILAPFLADESPLC